MHALHIPRIGFGIPVGFDLDGFCAQNINISILVESMPRTLLYLVHVVTWYVIFLNDT